MKRLDDFRNTEVAPGPNGIDANTLVPLCHKNSKAITRR